MGPTQYIVMDRNPVNGYKIHHACCTQLWVMLRMKLVEAEDEEGAHAQEGGDRLPHRLKVFKQFVSPWFHTDQLVFVG